jgi:hypothetical protein
VVAASAQTWSYTKVNRLLTEGRRAFLRRVSGIQRGADCARYEPLLSALADGEASPEDLAVLRPHMRTCLSCRAALREFRAAPGRVASVVPAAAFAASDHSGPVRSFVESLMGAAHQKADTAVTYAHGKAAAATDRFHAVADLAAAQKVAVVAASAAALAGGGTAIDEFANHDRAARAAQVTQEQPPEPPADASEDPSVPLPTPPDTTSDAPPPPDPAPAPAPEPAPPPPPPSPANEFDPTGAPAPAEAAPPHIAGGGSADGSTRGEFSP